MLSYQPNSKVSTKLSFMVTNPQKMTRKKERLFSSFYFEETIYKKNIYFINTIINIKF